MLIWGLAIVFIGGVCTCVFPHLLHEKNMKAINERYPERFPKGEPDVR